MLATIGGLALAVPLTQCKKNSPARTETATPHPSRIVWASLGDIPYMEAGSQAYFFGTLEWSEQFGRTIGDPFQQAGVEPPPAANEAALARSNRAYREDLLHVPVIALARVTDTRSRRDGAWELRGMIEIKEVWFWQDGSTWERGMPDAERLERENSTAVALPNVRVHFDSFLDGWMYSRSNQGDQVLLAGTLRLDAGGTGWIGMRETPSNMGYKMRLTCNEPEQYPELAGGIERGALVWGVVEKKQSSSGGLDTSVQISQIAFAYECPTKP